MPATATMKAMSPSDIRVIANMDAKRSTLPALARSSDCLHSKLTNARTRVRLRCLFLRCHLADAAGGCGGTRCWCGTGSRWPGVRCPGDPSPNSAGTPSLPLPSERVKSGRDHEHWVRLGCQGGLGEAARVGCCWVPAGDAGMTSGEGRGAREDWAGSEEPMDGDGQAIKRLWCWLDDRWGRCGQGGEAVDSV